MPDVKQYYLISMLIIIVTLIPFTMQFEKRNPKIREIVVIAVMSAVAVASRIAFFMIPQVKPVVAIVIITGVCFGAESGFLTGVIVGFVSNFYFGQGPWTPYQMMAFGLIGFLAGVIFKRRSNRLLVCIYGGIATFFLYGGIVNLSTLFLSRVDITWKSILAVYLPSIPFDLIHAGSTVVFLAVLYKPMVLVLQRIKKKYGFMDK